MQLYHFDLIDLFSPIKFAPAYTNLHAQNQTVAKRFKIHTKQPLHGDNVNRQEATGVLREVLSDCSEYIAINFVSLTDSNAQIRMKSTGYEIYIKCSLCEGLKQCLAPILEKRKLRMAEWKDAIIIYKPKPD